MEQTFNFRWDRIKDIKVSKIGYKNSNLKYITDYCIELETENRTIINLKYIEKEKIEELINKLKKELTTI